MGDSGAKSVGRNRPPRVQIQYELHTGGAKKLVELPFVVGVLADLAGKSTSDEAKKPLEDRKFLEIDAESFDKRMDALRPKVAFQVKNRLTGKDDLAVSIEFSGLNDFTPVEVAKQVEPLKRLLDARNALDALVTMMDGKGRVPEELLNKVLADPALLKSIVATNTLLEDPDLVRTVAERAEADSPGAASEG